MLYLKADIPPKDHSGLCCGVCESADSAQRMQQFASSLNEASHTHPSQTGHRLKCSIASRLARSYAASCSFFQPGARTPSNRQSGSLLRLNDTALLFQGAPLASQKNAKTNMSAVDSSLNAFVNAPSMIHHSFTTPSYLLRVIL